VIDFLSNDCLYRGLLPIPAVWETFDFEFGKYGDELSSDTWHDLDLSRVVVQSLIARQKERPSHTRVEYEGRARTMNLNLQFYEDFSAGAF
jgi:succinate dehydrogenase/fumarate reductase flavoprotein subunit